MDSRYRYSKGPVTFPDALDTGLRSSPSRTVVTFDFVKPTKKQVERLNLQSSRM